MNRRLRTLVRIERLQRLVRDTGNFRLRLLEIERAGLGDDLAAVFAALESEAIAYGPTAALAARRIRALELRLAELTRLHETASAGAHARGARARLAELARESAALVDRRLNERKELSDLIERSVARGRASPG